MYSLPTIIVENLIFINCNIYILYCMTLAANLVSSIIIIMKKTPFGLIKIILVITKCKFFPFPPNI